MDANEIGKACTALRAEEPLPNSLQLVLVKVLTDAEAEAAAESAQGALAHCETEAVEYLLNGGLELTARSCRHQQSHRGGADDARRRRKS